MLFTLFLFFMTLCGTGAVCAVVTVVKHWRLRRKIARDETYRFGAHPLQGKLDNLGFAIYDFLIVAGIGSMGLIVISAYLVFRFLGG